jgi:hypothetical protein
VKIQILRTLDPFAFRPVHVLGLKWKHDLFLRTLDYPGGKEGDLPIRAASRKTAARIFVGGD